MKRVDTYTKRYQQGEPIGPETGVIIADGTFLPMLLRALARRCYNGAGDPWQEFYDRGAGPLLERMADRLETSEGAQSPGVGHPTAPSSVGSETEPGSAAPSEQDASTRTRAEDGDA